MQQCMVPHSGHIVSFPFYHVLSHIVRYKRLLVVILNKSILDNVCNGVKMSRPW